MNKPIVFRVLIREPSSPVSSKWIKWYAWSKEDVRQEVATAHAIEECDILQIIHPD